MDGYLEELPLSPEVKAKVADLGATSAAALLGMVRASPKSFENYLGRTHARELRDVLETSISARERAVLDADLPSFRATGALVDRHVPTLPPPAYDIAERDRLFERLQSLRRQGDASPEARRRIAELEDCLTAMLEGVPDRG